MVFPWYGIVHGELYEILKIEPPEIALRKPQSFPLT